MQFWNGDKIADIIMSGMLREEFLPQEAQTDFRKAVGFVDEPDITRKYFESMVQKLVAKANQNVTVKERLRVLRQIYLCIWVLFAWGRNINNLRGVIEAAEFAQLASIEILRTQKSTKSKACKSCTDVHGRLTQLHLILLETFIAEKVEPQRTTAHYFSVNARGFGPVDVNLRLFELWGWVALSGLWHMNLMQAYRESDEAHGSPQR